MKPSAILREAARLVESRGAEEWWSCIAIQQAAPLWAIWWRASPLPPVGEAYAVLLGRLPTEDDFGKGKAANNHRVVALCLAAAIAESEGQ